MSEANLYNERLRRYVVANYNEKPDRIPIRIFAEELAAKYAGKSNFETAVDHELQFDVNRRFAVDHGCDAIQTNSIVNWLGLTKALGWDGIVFPGIGLPENGVTQWVEPTTEEGAFMKAGEYGALCDDPTAFLLERWLPRFTTHINPVGEPVSFLHNMSFINGIMAYNTLFGTWAAKTGELMDAGVVPAVGSVLKAPLDIIGDKLRGYMNLVYDLADRRDEVIRACEALAPHLFEVVAGSADPTGRIPSIIWMHRGCVPFISEDDFREIYWATLKPIVEELWARGTQIILYAEGDWSRHLESFTEVPEKSVIFHSDKTDIFKAHEVLGSRYCISGGVPNDVLTTGTKEDVELICRRIIEEVAPDGGYVMDAQALIMNDAKIENVQAMINFTREHGEYSDDPGLEIDDVIPVSRPAANPGRFPTGRRPPGVCVPWDEKKLELPEVSGNPDLPRKTWEAIDSQGYMFLWVNLTW